MDERFRHLQQRANLGDFEAKCEVLNIRLRLGQISWDKLELASLLGDDAAANITGLSGQLVNVLPKPPYWTHHSDVEVLAVKDWFRSKIYFGKRNEPPDYQFGVNFQLYFFIEFLTQCAVLLRKLLNVLDISSRPRNAGRKSRVKLINLAQAERKLNELNDQLLDLRLISGITKQDLDASPISLPTALSETTKVWIEYIKLIRYLASFDLNLLDQAPSALDIKTLNQWHQQFLAGLLPWALGEERQQNPRPDKVIKYRLDPIIRKHYEKGLSDSEIFEAVYAEIKDLIDVGQLPEDAQISYKTIQRWRTRQKFNSNFQPLSKKLHPKLLELYTAGARDLDMAQALELNRATVEDWRAELKLPANVARFGKVFRPTEVVQDAVLNALLTGKNQLQVSKLLGVNRGLVIEVANNIEKYLEKAFAKNMIEHYGPSKAKSFKDPRNQDHFQAKFSKISRIPEYYLMIKEILALDQLGSMTQRSIAEAVNEKYVKVADLYFNGQITTDNVHQILRKAGIRRRQSP